jgi:hypothetical protein
MPAFARLVLVYLGGGLLGGLVVGLLRPLTRSHLGAALVGVVATVPVGVAVRFLRYGLAAGATERSLVNRHEARRRP